MWATQNTLEKKTKKTKNIKGPLYDNGHAHAITCDAWVLNEAICCLVYLLYDVLFIYDEGCCDKITQQNKNTNQIQVCDAHKTKREK